MLFSIALYKQRLHRLVKWICRGLFDSSMKFLLNGNYITNGEETKIHAIPDMKVQLSPHCCLSRILKLHASPSPN